MNVKEKMFKIRFYLRELGLAHHEGKKAQGLLESILWFYWNIRDGWQMVFYSIKHYPDMFSGDPRSFYWSRCFFDDLNRKWWYQVTKNKSPMDSEKSYHDFPKWWNI